VKESLWTFHEMLYICFDLYAAAGTKDPFAISSNGFRQFTEHGGLAMIGSKTCDQSHLDQLFIAVNSGVSQRKGRRITGKMKKDKDKQAAMASAAAAHDLTLSDRDSEADKKHNSTLTLNRQEFIQCVVKLATMRFMKTGQATDETDVSRAVEALCRHLVARLPEENMRTGDDFRRAHCYIEETDTVLRKHESSLALIFGLYSEVDTDVAKDLGGNFSAKKLMGYDEFICMVTDLSLIEPSFTHREAKFAFVLSRMRAVDELSSPTRFKLHNLGLEDYYEALVRVATMKSWPTPDEVARSGLRDAGQFMLELNNSGKLEFTDGMNFTFVEFLATRDAVGSDNQPTWRKVEYLVLLMLRTVEKMSNDKEGDLKLTEKEVKAAMRAKKR